MKLVLQTIALFAALNVAAQSTILVTDMSTSLTVAANATVHVKSKAEDNVKSNFNIKNTSTTVTNQYKVKRYDMLLHSVGNLKAEAYFCFAGQCFGTVTVLSTDAITLTPGQSASDVPGAFQILTADLDELAATVGLSIVKYTFFNINNANDSLQFSIHYNDAKAPVGLKNETKAFSKAEMSPNPAVNGHTFLRVSSSTAFTSRLSIINSIGQVVSEKDVDLNASLNKIDVETSGLQAGVYFVRLSGNNETVTRRLIVN